MKITAERVVDTLKYGAFIQLREATALIKSLTDNASEASPAAIGKHVFEKPVPDMSGSDLSYIIVMLSLLFDEVAALRKEARALRKGKEGGEE